jgi:hypothetical protein
MLRKILSLFPKAKTENLFSKEERKKIEHMIHLHNGLLSTVKILRQDIYEVLDEIYFLTNKDLIQFIDFQFKSTNELHEVKGGYLVELENPKKGSGVFLVVDGCKGYYYIKGTSGNTAYIELCGKMKTKQEE